MSSAATPQRFTTPSTTQRVMRSASLTLTGLTLLLLYGCTAGMHEGLLGHGKEPLDSPQVMAQDSNDILERFEKVCFSERAVWRRTGTIHAECVHNYTSRWGLMDANIKWFEALTRGVSVFNDTVQTRYPGMLVAQNASAGFLPQPWGQERYWRWRYLLSDGSTTLGIDRTWSFTWNMMETAYSSEAVKVTLRLNMRNECLREHPNATQLVACPAMRQAFYSGPFNIADLDPAVVASSKRSLEADIAWAGSERSESEQADAAMRARQAQEQRDSQLATERGLQQGIGNVLNNTTIKPTVTVPSLPTQSTQTAQQTSQTNTRTGTGTAVPTTTQQPSTTAQTTGSTVPVAGSGTPNEPRQIDYQEAVVYCWATQSNQPPARPEDERWICHGPTQLIQAAETLPRAISQAGCGNALQQGRRWPMGQGTLYGCGFGRESYDENVVARYSVPSGITGQLQNYRCAVPNSGRCTTPR